MAEKLLPVPLRQALQQFASSTDYVNTQNLQQYIWSAFWHHDFGADGRNKQLFLIMNVIRGLPIPGRLETATDMMIHEYLFDKSNLRPIPQQFIEDEVTMRDIIEATIEIDLGVLKAAQILGVDQSKYDPKIIGFNIERLTRLQKLLHPAPTQ